MNTITEAAAALRAHKVSAVELAQESLRRIHAEQPRTNAFITVTEELALRQARQADDELARGIDRGPLHGIPYSLKDNFAVSGIRTTCGSKILADYVPDFDSTVYTKLTAAGAVLMGKVGLHEFAYGITSNNPHFGAVRNPHDPTRIPGGSSGGSGASVAANLVYFSIGTDTGGSIRIPASYCGCVGLKPTSGRISRYGVLPLDFSIDHMGPLTRSVQDAALVMNVLAGHDPKDDTSSGQAVADYIPGPDGLTGKRVGVPRNFFCERLAPEVAAAWNNALREAERSGAKLTEITLPDPAAVNIVGRVLLLAEASALLERWSRRRADFGEDVLTLLDQGRLLAATDYVNAQRLRRVCMRDWAKIWRDIDLLFTPTTAITAPEIGELSVDIGGTTEDVRLGSTRCVRPFNVLGLPAISVPMPTDGMPAGLQIVARPFGEAQVLAAAAVYTTSM